MPTKEFKWEDTLHTSSTTTLTLDKIILDDDEYDREGNSLVEWAAKAETGNEFITGRYIYTCIKS